MGIKGTFTGDFFRYWHLIVLVVPVLLMRNMYKYYKKCVLSMKL